MPFNAVASLRSAGEEVLEEVVEVSVAQLGASHRFTQFAKTKLAQVGS